MRSLRWLLLLIIIGIVGGVTASYRSQRKKQDAAAPAKPAALAPSLNASAEDWQWSQSSAGKPDVHVRAKNLRQQKDSNLTELEGLQLQIYAKDRQTFDLVKSAKAQFYQAESKLYSDGETEITLNVPVSGEPAHRLTTIKSSGLTFESKTGKAVTDRPTSFTFENGDGKCVGATYDPGTKELHLLKEVLMNLRGAAPGAKPMKIEAGELTYKEAGSTIWLTPWSRLTREQTVVDAAASTINIKDGMIDSIDSVQAHGVDRYPNRELDYSADTMHVTYSDAGELQKLSGLGNARLRANQTGSVTVMTADTVDLEFTDQNGESTLTKVTANNKGVVESKPLPGPDGKTAQTRILRSQTIEMNMRPGGREMETVLTHAPGTLEFLPNQPSDRRRVLNAERLTIHYADQNQIQSFEAVDHVTTETYPSEQERAKAKTPPAVTKTTSATLTAEFDPTKSQLTRMKQSDGFTYDEGDRHARADTATLDSDENIMDLEPKARIWDASGSTSADHIRLKQSNGDFTADGHVTSSRLADNKNNASAILDGDDPIQGTAERMTSANRNRLVHYEGRAELWQGPDRIRSDQIDIDREKRLLTATGHVVTQFMDRPNTNDDEKDKQASSKPQLSPPVAAPPAVFTIVRAEKLFYTDDNRRADYTGGVTLKRPDLSVKGARLQAYLNPKDSGEDSRINHAISDGKVEIVQITPERKRTGTGEHAEYYTADSRIVLRGGEPQLVDSKKGYTRGAELTYFADDDRLLVNGSPGKPVSSRLHRK